MDQAPTPIDEAARVSELRALGLLHTDAEERFDRYTRLAQRVFDVQVAMIALVDDEFVWVKSIQGTELQEYSRTGSFASHAINANDLFIVEDAWADPRFRNHPVLPTAPEVGFYGAVPLKGPEGHHIGVLSIIDTKPRVLDPSEEASLRDMGSMVSSELASMSVATTDPLTGICNRRGFDQLSEQAIAFCARSAMPVSVIMIDLDLFKSINDEWGHSAGDTALKELAAALAHTFRDSDVVGRLGGDEFAVLLSGTPGNQAQIGANRLFSAIDQFNATKDHPWSLHLSVGIAELADYTPEALQTALQRADQQMYAHKRARRLRRMTM